MIQELCDEPRSETARESSQAEGRFRALRRRSYPVGNGCYCADQDARTFSGGRPPPQGLSGRPVGHARKTASRGGPGFQAKPANPPRSGGATNRITRLQGKSSLRGKRSDPSRKANGRLTTGAVLASTVPTRGKTCRRVSTTSGAPLPAGSRRTGRRGLTQQLPDGNGRDSPAMRLKTSRTEWRVASGSTRPAQARAPNSVHWKERAASAHHELAPGLRIRGLFVATGQLRFASSFVTY